MFDIKFQRKHGAYGVFIATLVGEIPSLIAIMYIKTAFPTYTHGIRPNRKCLEVHPISRLKDYVPDSFKALLQHHEDRRVRVSLAGKERA